MADDLKTLVDGETEAAGFKIKPWGFVMLADLSADVGAIIERLKKKGVTWQRFKESIEKQTFNCETDILFSMLPNAPTILSKTLGLSLEEIDKIDQDKIGILCMAIASINMVWLKNLLSPLRLVSLSIAADQKSKPAT